MSNDIVADTLREAFADFHLSDPVEQVVQRGRRLRRARRARRLAVPAAGLLLTGAIGIAAGGGPASTRPRVVLAAVELPVCPVSLASVPKGLEVTTDLDGGPLRVHYSDGRGALIGISASRTRPPGEDGGAERQVLVQGQEGVLTTFAVQDARRATLVWQHSDGLWVRLVGRGEYADPGTLLEVAQHVVDRPVGLTMRLRVAPEGWVVRHYKDLDDGGVAALEDPRDAARGLTVALHRSADPGFDANDLEYRGSVTDVVVQGRVAHLVQAPQGWYLAATTRQGAWFTVQAPPDLSSDQVLQIAEGVTPA